MPTDLTEKQKMAVGHKGKRKRSTVHKKAKVNEWASKVTDFGPWLDKNNISFQYQIFFTVIDKHLLNLT